MPSQTHNHLTVTWFTVNLFEENSYILYDKSGDCVLIDPGCQTTNEQTWIAQYLRSKQLRVVDCWLTHAHLDHIFGCKWVQDTYGVAPKMHAGERIVWQHAPLSAQRYGIPLELPPLPTEYIAEDSYIEFGESRLHARLTPGHSPASLCFYAPDAGFVIAGDTLFNGSIGRTDLPGGHHQTLLDSIRTQLFSLPDATVVYSGHGMPTTIGRERATNPFLQPDSE